MSVDPRTGRQMRILAVSHACVVPINQRLFEILARRDDVSVTLIVPTRYYSDFDGRRLVPENGRDRGFDLVKARPALAWNGSVYFYVGGLRHAIRSTRPDVVLLDEEPWSLVALQALRAARDPRTRVVFYTKQNLHKHLPFPFRAIQQRVFQRSALALAISEEAAAVLRRKGYAGAIAVVPHGVDCAEFTPRDVSGERRSLGLSDFTFAYFGRLVEEKGVDLFIDAAVTLCGTISTPLNFLIVGSGPEQKRLRLMAQASPFGDRFVFHESVPHGCMASYLNACDVVVLPSRTIASWKEQFGRIVIEALACGVPVIGSDSGEIPRLLDTTGGGLVFQEGDAGDLARKMCVLCQDQNLRQRLVRTGRAHVMEHYSLNRVVEMLMESLNSISQNTMTSDGGNRRHHETLD